jgi:hypothetical protein
MSTAFVLGNGTSRSAITPAQLQPYGKIYGCNALYREFTPNVLVATDRPIATAIQESGYALKNQFYTRKPIDKLGALRVPADYYGYSSGPIAVSLAALDQNAIVYMLGFDMGPTANNTINNLYAGTEFYKPTTALPTFTGNWIKQISQIVKDFPSTEFVRVCGPTTAKIEDLQKFKNLNHLDIAEFLHRINNKISL